MHVYVPVKPVRWLAIPAINATEHVPGVQLSPEVSMLPVSMMM